MSVSLYELTSIKTATSSDLTMPAYGSGLNLSQFLEVELFIRVELTGSSSSTSTTDLPAWTIIPLFGNTLHGEYYAGEALKAYEGNTHFTINVAHSPDFNIMVLEDESGPASQITIDLRPISKS